MYSSHVSGYIPTTPNGNIPINVIRASNQYMKYKGVEHNGQIVVTIGSIVSSISQAFSFDLPSIGDSNATQLPIIPPHTSVLAGRIHQIAGFGFSTYDTSPQIRLGETVSEMTRWNSESRLTIRAGHGTGYELPITLTISLAKVCFTKGFTYDAPDMIWIRPTFSSTLAEEQVEIYGRDFGPFDLTGKGRIGGTAMEVTKWLSTTSLTSYIASGISFNLEVVLSAALWSIPTITVQNMNEFNFLPPSSTALLPPNGPINGGFSLTVFGFNYGLYDSTLGGQLGDQSCQATVWVSDSSALCQGLVKVPMIMNVGNQTAIINGTSDLFIYDAPSATGISKSNSPATGNVSIQIEGNQFGVSAVPVGVVVGKSLSPKSYWQSDSRIYFITPPGTGVVDSITLSIIRLTLILDEVDAPIFYYDKPNINAVQAANSPTNANGRYATVFGQNFGVSDQLVETSFGNAQYQVAQWSSDSSILSPVPAGYGDGKSLAVRVDSQIGETEQIFSYDIVTMSSTKPSNMFPGNMEKLTLYGINFIFLDTTVTSQIGATPMESTPQNHPKYNRKNVGYCF
ncbi:hypothetical protein GUITHDRAFT_141364 [Guillardia theta CCMP2712]|uniref:IPT/TIG domain-containing protein n=1 Tax=Guillardia theta (strain CCMP2712) TaxID=905079 RepID=L1J1F2_GUITC|nr:hypothetical protein GUITHDRAFT_141364 [Guillardia theta CCMP2712]EKX42147.1 hypothetical protein GUITHDRAFT_141364 [Guillardia theta CCMP2712]|eukprot:XP_005829127.1 hypothetical protein GUITHDRAFT_141364 [Guillardia theta CCMP2712]